MTMYTRKGDGLELIPADHEKVLGQYRDSMPLVWEPQSCGDSFPLRPLIEEPVDAGDPSRLEYLAKVMATRLRLQRQGKPGAGPQYEEMATEAARAYLADLYELILYVHFDEDVDPVNFREATEKDLTAAARKLSRTITRMTHQVIAARPPVKFSESTAVGVTL